MSSIQFVLIRAAKTLETLSETPLLDAEVLLCEALQKDRAYLRAWPELDIEPEPLATFNAYLAQRQHGTPIAYITGHREFWSRDFTVNPHVLIPRHDTELLIELCLKRIPRTTGKKLLDLGTGSGIIAVTLAVERPEIEVLACDKSAEALAVAKLNAKNHQVNRIQFHESNWFDAIPETQYDFIVSNPPYIAEDDAHLQQGDLRFEPQTALVSAKQGLHDIEHITRHAKQYLGTEGFLIIEHGYNQAPQVAALFSEHGYQHIETFLDLSGNPRVTCGQWLPQAIHAADDKPSDQIQSLTISRKLMQQLLHAAQAEPSLEVCGLIAAKAGIPYRCIAIKNVAAQPQTRFLLDTKQQINALSSMRENGERLFGIYHSHPTGPALPSKTDIQLAAYPEALHFIISLDTKGVLALRCFKLDHTLTQEIALSISD